MADGALGVDVTASFHTEEADMPARDPAPDHERSGRDIEESIARAERGSPVEGRHDLAGSGPSGASRGERIADVPETTEGRVEPGEGEPADPPEPGPGPRDIGSGGAQRIAGARIPDRKAGGEPVPDGPPFDEQE